MRAVLALLLLVGAVGVRAGANLGEDDHDEVAPGPTFFGFVKDAAGKAIADAKVVLTIKGSSRIIMRTNNAGMYRVGNLSADTKPAEVAVSCEKDGYKQTGVIRRTTRPVPGKPVEIECRMARG